MTEPRSPLPPLSLHLDPRRRDLLEQLLPAEARLALCLDHYRWLHPMDPALHAELDALAESIVDMVRQPWERELDALEAQSPDERLVTVQKAPPTEFASAELAGLVGAQSATALSDDPESALHWAELCGLVARRGSAPKHLEWRAHWLFLAADAYRACGDRREAARLFDLGQLQLRTTRTTDRTLAAERARILGCWHLESDRPAEALRESARAAALADLDAQTRTLGAAAQVLGQVYHRTGQYRRQASAQRLAIAAYRRAGDGPFLSLVARFRLAIAWLEEGSPRAARGVLLRAHQLFDRYPERPRLRLWRRWLIARIAAALGETDEARRIYREVLDEFLGMPSLPDAAVVALDLALLFSLEGDDKGLRWLADEIAPRFRNGAEAPPDRRVELVLALFDRGLDRGDAALGELIGAVYALRRALPPS